MLVLSRRLGEKIVITLEDGRQIKISVADFKFGHNKVRLGIEAPGSIIVDREEIAMRRNLPHVPPHMVE